MVLSHNLLYEIAALCLYNASEYNPGGGKDEVLKYLNESQKQVILAKSALEKILECLDVPK